jgi:hypothetical protein
MSHQKDCSLALAWHGPKAWHWHGKALICEKKRHGCSLCSHSTIWQSSLELLYITGPEKLPVNTNSTSPAGPATAAPWQCCIQACHCTQRIMKGCVAYEYTSGMKALPQALRLLQKVCAVPTPMHITAAHSLAWLHWVTLSNICKSKCCKQNLAVLAVKAARLPGAEVAPSWLPPG